MDQEIEIFEFAAEVARVNPVGQGVELSWRMSCAHYMTAFPEGLRRSSWVAAAATAFQSTESVLMLVTSPDYHSNTTATNTVVEIACIARVSGLISLFSLPRCDSQAG